ncbi:helix-turn-helix domain-containing protein [Geothrix sp. PMB-07]|uniref:helix-turn-helix domain-containing protein n=1 Tax=Geothrix sp. PMB-07 TaxID=3068640 RepID=UPI00355883FE
MRRGRPSKLSQEEWEAVCYCLCLGMSTSALARRLGIAKSTISERLSAQVKTIKHAAIELLRAEFSEQIRDEPPSEQAWLTGMNEVLIAYACAEMRRRHGRRQGRHSEP